MKALNKIVFLFAVLLIWASCKVEKVNIVTESTKSISGSWQVTQVVRNGTNITGFNGLDFSQFKINFTANNTYTLVNPIPFIVYQNGTYSLNDPQVPTQITFTASGTPAQTVSFTYPIVSGVRNIVLQFSTNAGCTDNTYLYTLQKVN